MGLAEIDQVGPGGNFLTAAPCDTFGRLTAEAHFPRLSLEAWQAQGNPKAGNLVRRAGRSAGARSTA